MWQESLFIFLENYLPAVSLVESTKQYSTLEVTKMLERHTGESIDAKEVHDTLKNRGFVCVNCGALELEWLFKEKE